MQRARPLLAALLIQSAWLSGENVLDLSVPMTTIETEEAGTYQAANAPLPSNSNTPAPSHRQTMSDQKTPDSNAQWQDDVLWDDFLDSDI